jgi:brefeldin A-resistance guanine nucleotide exchange factor 1
LPIDRGKNAVDLLFDLKKFLAPLIQTCHPQKQGTNSFLCTVHVVNDFEAWRQLCLPLLASLSRQSTNAAREIRHAAISHLQRIILGPHIILNEDHAQVEEIFNLVIFPVLDELLKPQVHQRDPQGMSETRLRASALLCKAFMHFEVRENSSQVDIRILWIQILDLLDRLMNINKGDQLVRIIACAVVRCI